MTFNSLPALDDSLDSLKKGARDIDIELIVVDNGSDDGSVECVKKHFPGAGVIQNRRNAGFAAACNQGAKEARGEYLLFHNPDLQLDEGAIGRMLEVYESHENVGAVAGRMRFPDGSFQATCRNFPTVRNLIFSRGSVLSKVTGGSGNYTLGDFDEITEVPAVAGTLMMVKKELFESLYGFDSSYFMYMEDTDFCLRLSRRSYKNYFTPHAGGVHLWGKGSRGGNLRRRWYHHNSVWKYAVRNFPSGISLIILPLLLANFVAAAALSTLTRDD